MIIGIEQIQMIEAHITKEIFAVSDRANMPVYMVCGSVLGIIRDNGFIPWDDDVDLGVPYDYYWEFIQILTLQLSEDYCVITPLNNKEYGLTFARVGINGIDQDAIHVDLFPMVGLPDKMEEQVAFSHKSDNLNKIYAWKHFKLSKEGRTVISYVTKRAALAVIHACLMIFTNNRLLKKFGEHCSQYPYKSAKYIMNACGHYSVKNIIPREYVEETVQTNYFGALVRVPRETDKYLKHYYKDYMKKPPVEKTRSLMEKTIDISDKAYEIIYRLVLKDQ